MRGTRYHEQSLPIAFQKFKDFEVHKTRLSEIRLEKKKDKSLLNDA